MKNRLIVVASALLVTGAVATTPAVAGSHSAVAASAHSVRITAAANNPKSFSNISARLGGSLGRGTQGSCCLQLPRTTYTWRFSGGTIHASGVSKIQGATVTGTWKVRSGSGKFKRVSGGGSFTGQLTTGKYVFRGTLRY